jgi:5-oxoprolinase (ATP-hydrolysing) subunit A
MKRIDLNCDMGELPEAVADGSQQALLRFVTSANIACGGHAGTPEMMKQTIEQALAAKVAVGAHPGYEDRANMGRAEQNLATSETASLVYRQLLSLQKIADLCGAKIGHVKPHGALYNQAARDAQFARGIADGVAHWCKQGNINKQAIVLVGLAGSVMLESFRAAGFLAAAEAFADRCYEPGGSLRSRKLEGALLNDPRDAAMQALRIVEEKSVIAVNDTLVPIEAQTICIHGDTPGALQIAEAVHRKLREADISIRALATQREKPGH